MSGNSFGKLFTVTTFGESHGPALGCVIDGCPPGMALQASDLQHDLNRRKPGQSRYTTQRKEDDAVQILSGVFEGFTTGTPIGLLVHNEDQKSKDYSKIKIYTGLLMLTIPMMPSMGCVIIAAAVDPLPEKPLCGWRLGLLPRSGYPSVMACKFGGT
jgi:hypothetical protein